MTERLRRCLRGLGFAGLLGAAAAGGWMAGRAPRQDCSLTDPPTEVSARLEADGGVPGTGAPDASAEAETAANTVQSASTPGKGPGMAGEVPGDGAAAGMADGPNEGMPELEAQEARAVLWHLQEENAVLRQEGEDLRRRVRQLSEALASTYAELDAQEVPAEAPPGAEGAEPATETRVLDANPGLGMVVLAAGRRQGMKAGLELTVLRDRRWTGRVRIVDVREGVSGAVVEDTPAGDAPKTGDRVVLTGGPKDSQGK